MGRTRAEAVLGSETLREEIWGEGVKSNPSGRRILVS